MENSVEVDKGLGHGSVARPTSSNAINTHQITGNSCPKVTYKATKLWLDAVDTFRSGVQVGKHRALFRQYDQCFVAQDAVAWFHLELQQKFDTDITRKQTVHLLQKFFKSGVFVEVSNQWSTSKPPPSGIKETDFKDNKRLYKLVEHNQEEGTVEPRDENSGTDTIPNHTKPNYYVVIETLSLDRVYEIWKNAFVERFVQVVGYDVFTSFLKPDSVHGFRIMHNMTKISPNGIVLPPSPRCDLPGWVMNAMKYVTQGPPASDDFQHTNYPGFENDVFGLIRDYFNTFKENAPLLTFELHDAFITTFIRAALFNGSNPPKKPYDATSKTARFGPRLVQEEKYPFNASDSTENLLLDMFTPSPKKDNKLQAHRLITKREIKPRRILGLIPMNSPLIENENYEPMEEKSYDINKYTKITTTAHVHATEEPVFLETAFTTERSPITRVISKAEIECSLGALRKPSTLNLGGGGSSDFAYENPHLELSPGDLVNHPKYSTLRATALITHSKVSSNASFEATLKGPPETDSVQEGKPETELTRPFDPQPPLNSKPPLPYRQRPYRSHSAFNLSDANQDRSIGYFPPLPPRSRGSIDLLGDQGFPQFLLSKYANSPSRSARNTMKILSGTKLRMSVMSTEGKQFAILSFRLLTLLLPSQNRRRLHLLLQFMRKLVQQDHLMLDVANTTRAIVINELSRAILGCSVEKEYDPYLAHQIVSFLMDNNQDIFDVSKEDDLKKTAEDQITEQQIKKIPMNSGRPQVYTTPNTPEDKEDKENMTAAAPSKCHQITRDEYEIQSLLGTTAPALRELLSACDALVDAKERRRQLKKFRDEYPHIFAEKYGEDDAWMESSTEVDLPPPPPMQSKKATKKLFRVLLK